MLVPYMETVITTDINYNAEVTHSNEIGGTNPK